MRALLLPLALVLAAAAPPRVAARTRLAFVERPRSPFPTSWRVGGLSPEHFELGHLRDLLRGLGPVGEAVLATLERSPYREILVGVLHGRSPSPALRAAVKRIGFDAWDRLLAGDPTARLAQDGKNALILLRVDLLLKERGGGGTATPPGLVAHELVHLAQATWGSLGHQEGGAFTAHDRHDEAEAELVEALIDRALLVRRRDGRRRTREERRLARLPPRPTRGALARILRDLERSRRYAHLPAGPAYATGTYDPGEDPFRDLPR